MKIYYPLLLLCYLEVRKKEEKRWKTKMEEGARRFFFSTSTSTRGVAEFSMAFRICLHISLSSSLFTLIHIKGALLDNNRTLIRRRGREARGRVLLGARDGEYKKVDGSFRLTRFSSGLEGERAVEKNRGMK